MEYSFGVLQGSDNPFLQASSGSDINGNNFSSEIKNASLTNKGAGASLLFVDSSVADYQKFAEAAIDVDVFILDATQNGIQQVSSVLATYANVASIHIVAHGAMGTLEVGNSLLDGSHLSLYQDEILGWGQVLAPDADILLYSCNVGEGLVGQAFVNQLGSLTGADIAASDDLTSSQAWGGDWDFEVTTGSIETMAAFERSFLERVNGTLSTLVVTNQTGNSISLYTANNAGGFSAPTTLPVAGTTPSKAVVRDINGDGQEDILTTDEGTDSLSLFINNGVGGFQAAQRFTVGDRPVGLVLGDVNRDGRLDAVVANLNTNDISVLLGSATSIFAAQQRFAAGGMPAGVGLADVNRDGNLDILAGNFQSNTVSVNLGTGTGSFGAPTAFAVGTSPRDLEVADLNNDGILDFVTANRNSNNVSVGLGNGTGGFAITNFAAATASPMFVAVGDINRDGFLDIATASANSNNVAVLLNNRAGGLGAATTIAVGAASQDILLQDINGDSNLDILTSNNGSNRVAIFTGNGAGTFTAQTPLATTVAPFGLAFGGFGSSSPPPADTTPPVFQTAVVNGSTLTLTYNETLDGVSDPAGGAYTVTVNGVQRTVNTVNANGTTVTLTLATAVVAGETVALNYTPPATNPVQDVAGNDAIALTGRAVINSTAPAGDTTPPVLQTAMVNGSTLTLTYNETLDGTSDPVGGVYTVTINGAQRTVNTVNANGTTVTLALASAVVTGETVALSYTPPTTNPVQDVAGNDAIALTGRAVTNTTTSPNGSAPSLVNAVVSGRIANSIVKLIYNERLDGNADPTPSSYTVRVNGAVRTVTAVDVQPSTTAEGITVILSLANPISQGDVVTVSYTPGTVAVQDIDGNDAAGFSNIAVTNLRNFTRSLGSLTVGSVFDFTQFGYTYDYGQINNFNTLPAGATNTTNLDIRKNAIDMTAAEIDAYINSILTLKETTLLTNNGVEISLYDQFVALHISTSDAVGRQAPNGSTMVNPAHGGPAFLPWHRPLVAEYEDALQLVNPTVTLPFWDWTNLTATNNIVFQDNFMSADRQGPVDTGYFTLANGWGMRTDLSGTRWTGINANPVAISRGSRVTNPGTWATNITSILGNTTYGTFRNNLEQGVGAHNNAHGSIGGIMSNVAASPNDPMFWMLHANVDRLWAEWQISNHWGTGFYVTGSQNYAHNLNDPLLGWDNGAIPLAPDLRDLLPKSPGTGLRAMVSGNITVNGTLQNNTVVAPGNSPGVVSVKGDYIQGHDGELTIELTGRKAGKEYDVLTVAGTAKLSGTLNLYFLNDFAPKHGTFTFLTADSIEGDFTDVNLFGLDQPMAYKLIKSGDGKSYQLQMMGLDEMNSSNLGIAQTQKALFEDTDLSLYNPSFGIGLDMAIYGYGPHGWGDDVMPHSDHGMDTDWYLPYDVDVNEWIIALEAGAMIPKAYRTPMMPGDHSGHDPCHSEHGHHHPGHHTGSIGDDDHHHPDRDPESKDSHYCQCKQGNSCGKPKHPGSEPGEHDLRHTTDLGDHAGHSDGQHGHAVGSPGDDDHRHPDRDPKREGSSHCQCKQGNSCGKPKAPAPESKEHRFEAPVEQPSARFEAVLTGVG